LPTASTPTASPTARTRRRGEVTAERILDAAEALFAAHGYAGTSLRDVALAVDLRIPSLYNHFDSKESLYAAVLERVLGPVLAALAEPVFEVESRRRLIELVMELLARHPNLPRLVQHEILTGGERLSPLLRDWLQPVLARAEETIQTSGSANHWEPEQLPLLALAMLHVVIGYFSIAPTYRDLTGIDLLDARALERHTRFFHEFVARLLPE
jgi:AcrR family transcriptional regulator